MNYQRPTEDELPAALAEVMGWTPHLRNSAFYVNQGKENELITSRDIKCACSDFSPLTNRNHSHLAVERCAELGLMQRYSYHLGQMGSDPSIVAVILATPAQESYASHRTLWEHRQQKGKQ